MVDPNRSARPVLNGPRAVVREVTGEAVDREPRAETIYREKSKNGRSTVVSGKTKR